MRTYYQILRVSEKASAQEIKSSFKRLAVMYHPDKNPDNQNAEEQFKLVNEAYQVLSNDTKKFIYDQRLYAQRTTPPNYSGGGAYQGMGGGYMRGSRGRRANWSQHRRYQSPNMNHGKAPTSPVRPKYDAKKDQWNGIVGAIGFVGSIALVLSLFVALYNVALRMEQSEILREQSAFLTSVRRHHQTDRIHTKLEEIDQRIRENGYNPALANFRATLIDEVKNQAIHLYKRGRYNKALSYMNLQKLRFPEDAKWLDPQIFQCYKSLNDYEKAERLLHDIRSRNDSHLFVYLEMAQIYHHFRKDPAKALLYYDSASKQIIKGYQQDYGHAFALSMDPTTQSETQYDVFLAKAILEYESGNFSQAKASAGWAHQLRPMKTEPIAYKARASMALGDQASACGIWRDAMMLGHTYYLDSLIKYKCQPQ